MPAATLTIENKAQRRKVNQEVQSSPASELCMLLTET